MKPNSPTINKDGSLRKIRENNETNFKWTEELSMFAFFCHKAGVNPAVTKKLADKLGVSYESLKTRSGEFQTYRKYGKTEKVTKMTEKIITENDYRTIDECERKIEILLGDDMETEDEIVKKRIEELANPSSLIPLVSTKDLIDTIINNGYVKIGGNYINGKNLVVLKSIESLQHIESGMEGCYFIFSNLPQEKIPVFSKDGFKCQEKSIVVDGIEYKCLYNGKGNSVKERLRIHLFNPQTLEKIKPHKDKTICGTGAMSLVSLSKEEFEQLEKDNKFNPSIHKLKPVEKSIQESSFDKRIGHQYFLNGIDITEQPWCNYKFAVVVLKSDSEFGKILIEEAFCVENGSPPLCRRHG